MPKPNKKSIDPPPPPPSAHLFNRSTLKCFQDGPLTIFDYELKNALLFSQGNWSLIRRDLLLAGIDPICISSLEEAEEEFSNSDSDHCSNSGVAGPCAILMNAFRVRKELIHYKKVCLHLFVEARRTERELKQAMAFFFWFDGDDPANGNRMHLEAICESHPVQPSSSSSSSSSTLLSPVSRLSLSSSSEVEALLREATARHAAPSSCTLLDRKRLYVLASATWMYHRGVSRAIQDARDVAKAICMSPRHPDGESNGERPAKLANLPGSMYVKQACDTAARDDPCLSRGERKRRDAIGAGGGCIEKASNTNALSNNKHLKNEAIIDGNRNSAVNEYDEDNDDSNDDKGPCAPETAPSPSRGHDALHKILETVRSNLSWPPEAIDFLSKSIIARGGFKALAIVEELQHYHHHISRLPTEVEIVLDRYNRAQSDMVRSLSESNHVVDENEDEDVNADVGSAAVNRHRHIHQLRGALDACRENAKWVAILERMARDNSENDDGHQYGDAINVISNKSNNNTNAKERLFVSSDDLSSSCAFVPKNFQLGTFVAESRRILDNFLIPAMRHALTIESWPPKEGSRRTRVLAFDRSTIGDAVIGSKKLQSCTSCEGMFDSRWIRLGLCSVCEDVRRRECHASAVDGDQRCCLFERCKFRFEAYCPHFGRCFVCDAPHSCERLCRLSRGNGEVATMLVETLQPRLLLIDFDRTMCSTKSGASPLPPPSQSKEKMTTTPGGRLEEGRQRRRIKEGYAHTIDADLRIAIAAQRSCGSSHVVTRNSHRNEIQTFLRMHDMEELANNVHVVPKKKAKGEFIREYFFEGQSSSSHYDDDLSNTSTGGVDRKGVCLFIDDDIRELVSDPWMRNNEQIHRLLFTRAFHM